ncbi:MAG TPA: prolipoprotein diacylglyceryl transferase [Actinomycetes bacterium]|nr:prolipoprotein diacylglyceryl transferase [Actinomycetes bacterium]
MTPLGVVASIPSPAQGVWHLGPIPVRGYALSIIVGIGLAIWIGERRWRGRGGTPGVVMDVAVWAVPFGIVGGRIYHVITTPQPYFGSGGDPWAAFRIWEGGLGIWGAVALGGVGAWIGTRRLGVPLPAFGDAVAPGIAVAQAVGRWGNWFNQELYGRPTDLPWALEIDVTHRPAGSLDVATYHPTFLYESIWLLLVAAALVVVDRRFRLGHGRVFALYVGLYSVGRFGVELLRIDPANEILGLRVNLWVAALVVVGAAVYFVVSARRRPGREPSSELQVGATDQEDAP